MLSRYVLSHIFVFLCFICPFQHDKDTEAIDLDESHTTEEETGDSASDKSEERTDNFEDDTVAGIIVNHCPLHTLFSRH